MMYILNEEAAHSVIHSGIGERPGFGIPLINSFNVCSIRVTNRGGLYNIIFTSLVR